MPITHWADVHALVSLQVTLTEKFLHDALSPLSINVQRFRWVTEVSTVHQILQYLYTQQTTLWTCYGTLQILSYYYYFFNRWYI